MKAINLKLSHALTIFTQNELAALIDSHQSKISKKAKSDAEHTISLMATDEDARLINEFIRCCNKKAKISAVSKSAITRSIKKA